MSPQWILVVVLLLSALIALVTLASQRVIAKKRAAYDYMVEVKGDQGYLKNQQIFVELAMSGQLDTVVGAQTTHQIEQRESVRNYLNSFELLCVSIEMNIVDEDVCKAFLYGTLIKRWNDSQPLIAKIRTSKETGGSTTTFQYFERVARRWTERPEPKYKQTLGGIARHLLNELFRI